MQLREEGLSREIGLTNFDVQHLIMVIKNGIEIASNLVCFSLLDPRAAKEDAGDAVMKLVPGVTREST